MSYNGRKKYLVIEIMTTTKLLTLTAVCRAAMAAPMAPQAAIPSVHPLAGPAPPAVPEPPHGSPRTLDTSPAPPADNTNSVEGVGKFWHGWQGVQKYFPLLADHPLSPSTHVTNIHSGDSYSQTGFDPTQAQPSAGIPLGNPAYPGYTSSNGPNYIDYLTTTYNATFLETYNLAYGGATVDSDLVAQYAPTVKDFRSQVNTEFIPYYVDAQTAGWTSDNSLFSFFFGINDVGNSYYMNNATLNGDIFSVYGGLVYSLYQAGARNFLFLNVPPVDQAPLTAANGASAQQQEASDIADFNSRIAQLASTVASYADATVFTYDTNALFSQVLQNPAAYPQTAGLKNTTSYCAAYENGTPAVDTFDPSCGVPVNQYFWLNSLHPTYPIHDVIAQQIAAELTAGTCLGC